MDERAEQGRDEPEEKRAREHRQAVRAAMSRLAMTAASMRVLSSQLQYAVNAGDEETVRDLGQALMVY